MEVNADNQYFWAKLEKDLSINIPNFIKNGFQYVVICIIYYFVMFQLFG